MLWATGVGAEVIRPMAAPVLGGLLIADEVIDVLLAGIVFCGEEVGMAEDPPIRLVRRNRFRTDGAADRFQPRERLCYSDSAEDFSTDKDRFS